MGRNADGASRSSLALLTFVFALTLVFAAPASASTSVVGVFPFKFANQGNAPSGETVGRPLVFGVNASGAGEASPGDLYVLDAPTIGVPSDIRVLRFSAADEFLESWGMDVVASGPDQANEIQSVRVDATGGSFKLSFGGETTADIPAVATAGEVQSALNALTSISVGGGSVTVSGGPGDANGSTPYLISFDGGSLAGQDQPQITAANGGTPLSGGTSTITAVTTRVGATGYETCRPASGDVCKSAAPGEFAEAGDLVVDQGSGDVYVTGGSRINKFSATGKFLSAYGFDDVASGPDDSSGDEQQSVTVKATGGSFALRFESKFFSGETETTAPIPFNASDSAVKAALDDLTQIGGNQSSVSVTGGPGDGTGSSPYLITFHGLLGGDDLPEMSASDAQLTGPGKSAEVVTTSPGGGYEICGPGDVCKESRQYFGSEGERQGAFYGNALTGLAVAPSDAPNAGNLLIAEGAVSRVSEYTSSGSFVRTFGFDVDATSPGTGFEVCTAASGDACKAGNEQNFFSRLAVDSTGAIYAIEKNNFQVVKLTPQAGPPELSLSIFGSDGAPNGTGPETSPEDLSIGPDDHLFVTRKFPEGAAACPDGSSSPTESRVQEFSPGGELLETSDPCAPTLNDTHTEASRVVANPVTGNSYVFNRPDFFGFSKGIRVFGHPTLPPDLVLDGDVSQITPTSGIISGTINPNGPGNDYPDTTGDPMQSRTIYRVEYKKASAAVWSKYSPDIPVGGGTDPIPFSVSVGGLAPKTEYELRVVVVKPFTATVEQVKTFTTLAAPPEIEAFSSSEVALSSATLHALINPQGTATTYHFEYGTTSSYGRSTAEREVGESLNGQAVADQITGLEDKIYHFRVVATNAIGTTTSADQTFTFHPPSCPNQTVRQQTNSAYLPDCRAYELVSPENAGGTVLFTGGPQSAYATNPPRLAYVGQYAEIPGSSDRSPIDTAGDLYVATRGSSGWKSRYIGPGANEAGCVGGRPIVDGTGPPTTIQNDVMADPGLNRFLDWNLGNPLECTFGWTGDTRPGDFNTAALGSNAPYEWNANGDFLNRWPTSVSDAPGSEANFACPQDPQSHPYPEGFFGNIPVQYFCSTYVTASKDLNHFIFSTQSGLFGEGGLSVAPGSAYDNDTVNNTLTLVSKLPSGEPIPQEPGAAAGAEELIQFPAVSSDGSHILMGTATKPACKQVDFFHSSVGTPATCPMITQPTHLYMRVDHAVTYDVSDGRAVKYIGSTPDGSKVYFSTAAQLTGDDTDHSVDIYMWSENHGTPQLTRISTGDPAPAGNSDSCVSSWTTNCDVIPYEDSRISAAPGNRGGLGGWASDNPNPGYTDNAIAAKSGDIYFYSPEQLVPSKGAPGKENLYVYRNGGVRFVAALEDDPYCIGTGPDTGNFRAGSCSNGALGRLQVTPDGRYAALVTTSRITAYDNHGFAEMYRYDADAEQIICVSCRPDGSAPEGDVFGSEGGRFLTEDGRVFFETPEPLDPRDTNAGIGSQGQIEGTDVYEFVDGRPQLITTGTGTGASQRGFASESVPGLYGVSADGVDVYFGTFDTLVGQDRNGNQLKFYDARTNGGFPLNPAPTPCAAADECHGPSSSPPAPLPDGTGAALGDGGNAGRAHKQKHHKKKHRQKRAARSGQSGKTRGGSR